MPAYVALLRAVNVGGTGKLPMSDLTAMCDKLGLASARTYIASGNVIFTSPLGEAEVKAMLEAELAAYAGRPVEVLVRTAAEMAHAAANNPFPGEPGNRTLALFVDALPADPLVGVNGQKHEKIALGIREIYISYGEGIAESKLKIPAAKTGTARNMNTVDKLAQMAAAL